MAIYITRLNGGNITIGSSGGSSEHPDTWYKYAGDSEWRTVSISGAISGDAAEATPTTQIPNVYDVVALEIGTDVTSIGDETFDGCTGLTSVTIPDSVTSIGDWAFYECGLTNITIPNSVTSIGEGAFSACSRLTSVTIPDSVTSIGVDTFNADSSLISISVGSGNTNYKSVNGLLLSKDGETLIQGVNGVVTIPDSVKSIGPGAFFCYSGLTSVTIPDSVTSIGDGAFGECSSLTSMTIPNSVTSIENGAFSDCRGLTSVTFLGKTLEEVQEMENYPWEISDTSIINVA